MKCRSLLVAALAASLGSAGAARAQVFTGLTSTGTLVTFNAAMPGTVTNTATVSGLTGGDTLVAIDYRPFDQVLIGLGYNSAAGTARVYSIAIAGATATATSINANTLTLGTGLARVTADFNPTANAIRVVTSAATGNNLRIPAGGTGALATDTDLNPANNGIRATAYSRNTPGGGTNGATTLYEIDGTFSTLDTQGSIDFFTGSGTSPNSGTLMPITGLNNVAGSTVVGFDISNTTGSSATSPGNAFLATGTTFYTFNLGVATATSVGNFAGITIADIAAVPEPGSMALCGLAAAGFVGYVRKRRKA